MTPGGAGRAGGDRGARGREAEAIAAAFLERQGYEVLARNHATRRGEVDLVCREAGTLCFVEVRSRSRLDFGRPEESVTVAKARRVVSAATDWALQHGGLDRPMRFDVVAVDRSGPAARCTLFRNAFDARGRRT